MTTFGPTLIPFRLIGSALALSGDMIVRIESELLGLRNCSRSAADCSVVLLDKLERVPEVALCILKEVEAGPPRRLVNHVGVTVVPVLFPCAIYVELASLIGDRIILSMLVLRHHNVFIDLTCHFRQLLVETCVHGI